MIINMKLGCVTQTDCASVSPCRKCSMDYQCVEMECNESLLKGTEVFNKFPFKIFINTIIFIFKFQLGKTWSRKQVSWG